MFPTVGWRITGVVGAVHIDRPGGSRGGVELEGRDWAGSFECASSTSGGIRRRAEQSPAVLSTEVLLPDAVQEDVETDTEVGMPATVMLRTLLGSPVDPRHSLSPHG